jgi:enoyl-[acyl-carrier protein] reductase II
MEITETPLSKDREMPLLSGFMREGARFLGVRYPIICGAMTWVSDHKLVGAISNLGGFGQLPGGNSPVEVLREEIEATRKVTDRPFGVNLITVAPNYQQHLDLVCEMGCEVVIFAGSIPRAKEILKAKDAGAKVICFASTEALAFRLIHNGADALILEGSEAGGHIGPVSLIVLLQQILFKIDSAPVFTAGGIATGKMMAHMLMMGAAGIQMGTRFVMSEECSAHDAFKAAFKRAKARDAMATPQFDSRLPVIPVRALKNKGADEFNKLQLKLLTEMDSGALDQVTAQFEVERFWMGGLRRAVVEGDVDGGSMMAGQSVGLAKQILPLSEILKELLEEGEATMQQTYQKMKGIS